MRHTKHICYGGDLIIYTDEENYRVNDEDVFTFNSACLKQTYLVLDITLSYTFEDVANRKLRDISTKSQHANILFVFNS
jgi:hypothetical protein